MTSRAVRVAVSASAGLALMFADVWIAQAGDCSKPSVCLYKWLALLLGLAFLGLLAAGLGVGFMSFIGMAATIMGVVEGVTGKSMLTGASLSGLERALGLLGGAGELGGAIKELSPLVEGVIQEANELREALTADGKAAGITAEEATQLEKELSQMVREVEGLREGISADRSTIAIARGINKDGEVVDYLTASGRGLSAAEKEWAEARGVMTVDPGSYYGEVRVGSGTIAGEHAEVKAIGQMVDDGFSPIGIATNRPFCPDQCAPMLPQTGANVSPTGKFAWWGPLGD